MEHERNYSFYFCSLQKVVKDIAHQAFWDLLKEELGSDPPEYSRALTLLAEIKEVCIQQKQSKNYFFLIC